MPDGENMKSVLLALHAHLPYVRHPEWDNFLEEQWLFEAVVETYAPLVLVLEELRREKVPVRLTLTLSPTLLLMLDDGLLHDRTVRFVETRLRLLDEEAERHSKLTDPIRPLVKMYRERFTAIRQILNGRGGLIRSFRSLEEAGMIEIITCGATHGFLPHLIQSVGTVERQVATGCRVYERLLGHHPRGIWLPECGFIPGIEEILAVNNIEYFFTESHGIELASPGKHYEDGDPLVPVKTPAGPVAFGRDRETSKAVWSSVEGYPGDPYYRDFYRDVGFDLPAEVVAPYLPPAVEHTFTGIKYHRITGETEHKEPYDRDIALAKARGHARDFVRRLDGRLHWIGERGMNHPLVVCPYDAELFGHWWFEGIDWLGFVFRELAAQSEVKPATATDFMESGGDIRRGVPAHSSWGDGGYGEVWGSEQAEWVFPHVYGLNHHLRRLKVRHRGSRNEIVNRALVQFERELLLLESSDWPFILHTGTQTGYAKIRLAEHLENCRDLKEMLETGNIDEGKIKNMEWKHPSFEPGDIAGY